MSIATDTTQAVETIYEAVIDAIVEYHRQGYAGELNPGNWYYIEVSPAGAVSQGEAISPCYSANEYYGEVPHYLTAWSDVAAADWGDDEPCDIRADVENVIDVDGIRRDIEVWVAAGNLHGHTTLAA